MLKPLKPQINSIQGHVAFFFVAKTATFSQYEPRKALKRNTEAFQYSTAILQYYNAINDDRVGNQTDAF